MFFLLLEDFFKIHNKSMSFHVGKIIVHPKWIHFIYHAIKFLDFYMKLLDKAIKVNKDNFHILYDFPHIYDSIYSRI